MKRPAKLGRQTEPSHRQLLHCLKVQKTLRHQFSTIFCSVFVKIETLVKKHCVAQNEATIVSITQFENKVYMQFFGFYLSAICLLCVWCYFLD